jgi:hypothetical protein
MMTDEEEERAVGKLVQKILKSSHALPIHVILSAITRSMATIIIVTTPKEDYDHMIEVANDALRESVRGGAEVLADNSGPEMLN